MLPLARYLFGIGEHALPTLRDQFAHNMTFKGVCLSGTPDEAVFIYLPVNYSPKIPKQYAVLCAQIERLSKLSGKAVVIQAHSADVVEPELLSIPFTHFVYLNSALVGLNVPGNFAAMPFFIPDCLERYCGGNLEIIVKRHRATVGFCGVAAPLNTPFTKTKFADLARLAITLIDELGGDSEKIARSLGTNMKHAHRTKAILLLKGSAKVDLDLLLRPVGGLVNNNYTNRSDMDAYNVEFYSNLRRNLYNLCSRGTENYSVRFYETLCMGRIPVLLDTNVVLPFPSRIDYERHCILVTKKQISGVAQMICDFHDSRTSEEIARVQLSNRALWEEYFSSDVFYQRLSENLPILVNCGGFRRKILNA